ncbi:hypothetical protein GobsT_40830 [Gemmata obscuriglobus]|uniref:Uncharacterized protein n=1 Tax=Gemmata obscuriglobus TaxID=114 RepID=A0A2Z3GVX4_9BACT|nr:hypothetical protein [Gemmata obscuriglobus]AWM37873.1 hypothetical protein C1280_13275 [Gemmata obscuriglobus]QEG29288.1 hypothetical protein GobsT_40830 [Gemmata obscuriglobus]VTS08247.1 Membrane protein OS=Rhodopirellula sp. SWK7 GN=RRSWK_01852 PE=4 SV=1 [Gemmata obscuriglobus UQM 2246]
MSEPDWWQESPASEPSARAVFLSWERFRLAYNLILAAVVVLTLAVGRDWSLLSDVEFLIYLVVYGLGANLCFGAGPWVEGWLLVFRTGGVGARWTLFVLGTALAALLTAASVMAYRPPVWD